MTERNDEARPPSSEGRVTIRIGKDASGSINTPMVIAAAATLGPLATAFCTELGKRFGGTVAEWASRIHFLPNRRDPAKTDLLVRVDKGMTVLEIDEDLPDEARLALLDLDVTTLRGHRLIWSAEAEAWIPTDLHGWLQTLRDTET